MSDRERLIARAEEGTCAHDSEARVMMCRVCVEDYADAAVREEHRECLRIADDHRCHLAECPCQEIADAIRARGAQGASAKADDVWTEDDIAKAKANRGT